MSRARPAERERLIGYTFITAAPGAGAAPHGRWATFGVLGLGKQKIT